MKNITLLIFISSISVYSYAELSCDKGMSLIGNICVPADSLSRSNKQEIDYEKLAEVLLKRIPATQATCAPNTHSWGSTVASVCDAIPNFVNQHGRGITATLIATSIYSGYLAAYRPSMYLAFGLSFLPIDFFWTAGMVLGANLAPATWPIATQIGQFNNAPVTYLAELAGAGIKFVASNVWQAVGGNAVNQVVQQQGANAFAWWYSQQALNALPPGVHSGTDGFASISNPSSAILLATPGQSTAAFKNP